MLRKKHVEVNTILQVCYNYVYIPVEIIDICQTIKFRISYLFACKLYDLQSNLSYVTFQGTVRYGHIKQVVA